MQVKQTFDLKSKCTSKPKLRTFNTFMDFGTTPSYLLIPLSFVQKMFLAKTRLAALPIRLETGRYERPRLLEQERLCPSCQNGIFLPSKRGQVQIFRGISRGRSPREIPRNICTCPSLDGRSNILISVSWTLREWCSHVFFTPSRSLRARIHTPSRRLRAGAGILARS